MSTLFIDERINQTVGLFQCVFYKWNNESKNDSWLSELPHNKM